MTLVVTNTSNQRSKVYLVGAGPGDPDLLTLKAHHVLQQADVIIHDYLVNPCLLKYAAPDTEIIDAGKRSGLHTIPQEQINELIVQKALENKIVVRLKGGDPFIFGRGGEELAAVVEAHIPFEVVPGVSSVSAVPAYAGIPLTHRNHSSNVVFLTGIERPDKPQTLIAWDAIAKMGTIVVMMGLSNLEYIAERLIAHGCPPDKPTATIQWGTWPQQRTVMGTLSTISQEIKEKNLKPPALTIIGDVCLYRDAFNWFEKKPLFGQHILVTRTETHASSLSGKLHELGAQVTYFPTVCIEPPSSWDDFDTLVQSASPMDWVIFTSANGVEYCMKRLKTLGKDVRIFGSLKIACVGATTAEFLETFGLVADIIPDHFQSEGLIDALKDVDLQNKQVWLPQAEVTRNTLEESLLQRGATVHHTPVYRNTLPQQGLSPLIQCLQDKTLDWITVTSPSAIKNLVQLLPTELFEQLKAHPPRIACIGEITAKAVRLNDLPVDVVPLQQNVEGMVNAICDACQQPERTLKHGEAL